jgi:hypothetical protein
MVNAIKNPTSASLAELIVSLVLPVFLISSFAAIAVQPELRLAVPLLIGVTALITTLLSLALYCGDRAKILWSPFVILAVALVLRLLFLFAPPQLSDDIYRYLWDGSNLLQGVNPYAAAPSAIAPSPELKDVHTRVNHPDYITIYPPTAQLVFAGGAASGGTITGLKAFLVLLDLVLCALLIMLLKQLELPAWRAVLYAWNPLPVLEIAGSGHVDGSGLTMLIGSICLLLLGLQSASTMAPRRWTFYLSGALLACASLVKLFPLALTPVLFLLVPTGRRRHFASGFIVSLAALVLPFLPYLGNMTTSLDVYARNWEFAGFAFNTIRAVSGSGTSARVLLAGSFLVTVLFTTCRLIIRFKATLSPVDRGRQALVACYAIAMALLLLTPTLQPWYALSLAVFLPFCAGPAGVVLCWTVFLTYQVQIPYFILGQWTENPQVTAAVFFAPVAAYLLSRVLSGARQAVAEPGQ